MIVLSFHILSRHLTGYYWQTRRRQDKEDTEEQAGQGQTAQVKKRSVIILKHIQVPPSKVRATTHSSEGGAT